MPDLSYPQARVLALWSFGIVLAHTCGLTRVSSQLAELLHKKKSALRQQLREWLWDHQKKRGRHRLDWQAQASFAALLKWVLSWWQEGEQRLVLVLDATSLKKVFVVLSISVVYRGCAIPVAWQVLSGVAKGSWKPHWLALLCALEGVIPPQWQVLVMADRGLYAPWLYQAIVDNHWHPFLRINRSSTYRPLGKADFRSVSQLLSAPGTMWAGRVTCFASNSIQGTLLACWEKPATQPWVILTDLPPESASAFWYGLRSWIEGGFKDLKRDGWQWQRTRMTDPVRAGRFWLALALATLWVVSVGGASEAHLPECSLEDLPAHHIARKTKKYAHSPRWLSVFQQGLIQITAALIQGQPVPTGCFLPEPWPLKTYP